MVDHQAIISFANRVAEQFHPERIILFGSYAYGTPTKDSDVDLMVVVQDRGRQSHKAIDILTSVKRDFPLDLLVRTTREIEKRIKWNDFFILDIVEKGLCLYDAADKRVGAKGRRRLRNRADVVPTAKVA
jgi:uncharacterized protein